MTVSDSYFLLFVALCFVTLAITRYTRLLMKLLLPLALSAIAWAIIVLVLIRSI